AAGLYWLSYVNNPMMAFAAATVFGVGIAYFWPTMLGVTAERFPKGGALLLGLIGCVGNLAIAYTTPQMGAIYDSYTVHNLPTAVQKQTLKDAEGNEVPMVKAGEEANVKLPPEVEKNLFPAGNQKLNPAAVNLVTKALDEKATSAEKARVPDAKDLKKEIDA